MQIDQHQLSADDAVETATNQGSLSAKPKVHLIHKLIPHTRAIATICAAAVMLTTASILANHAGRPTHPIQSIQIAGVTIKNMDKADARKELDRIAENQKIKIVVDNSAYAFTANELGIKRDITSLLDANYAPSPTFIDRFASKKPTATRLETYVNQPKLTTALETKLGQYKMSENASLSVDADTIVVNPAKAGISLDFKSIVQQIEQSDLHDDLTITAKYSKLEPDIPTEAANNSKAVAEALLVNSYSVTSVSNGSKSATKAQRAAWLVFTPNPGNHRIEVSLNAAAARKTMSQLAKDFEVDAKDRVTLTIGGGAPTTIDEGQDGISLDEASLADGLQHFETALAAKQPYAMAVTLSVQPKGEDDFGTVDGGKFILVDVPKLKAYAMENTDVVRTMLVSTGIASMPTPAGHFKILSKTPLITMKGCNKAVGCWTVPNVPNAQFFTSEGHAFHGTYWHNMFGKANMSHGCVNLSLDDASWLYGWTEVGTDVIIIR